MDLVFPVMTAAEFPHGLRCPSCDQLIKEGQPYAARPSGVMPDGSTVSTLTCVYC